MRNWNNQDQWTRRGLRGQVACSDMWSSLGRPDMRLLSIVLWSVEVDAMGDIPLTDRRPAAGDIVSRETGKPLRAGVMLGVLLCLSRTPSHTAVAQFLMHQEWPQLNASSNPPYRARQRPLGLTAHFSNFVPTICARASSTHLVSALAGSSGGTGSGSSWDYASFRQRRGQARSKRAHTRWCLRWKG